MSVPAFKIEKQSKPEDSPIPKRTLEYGDYAFFIRKIVREEKITNPASPSRPTKHIVTREEHFVGRAILTPQIVVDHPQLSRWQAPVYSFVEVELVDEIIDGVSTGVAPRRHQPIVFTRENAHYAEIEYAYSASDLESIVDAQAAERRSGLHIVQD